MKKNQFPQFAAVCVALLLATVFTACKEPNKENTLQSYFKSTETGLKTGGIKIVSIETPKPSISLVT